MEFSMDEKTQHFLLHLPNGEFAYINYRRTGDHFDLPYSYVPPSQRGKGIGRELVKRTLDYIDEQNGTAAAQADISIRLPSELTIGKIGSNRLTWLAS